ncbi:LysR family transcriptional regulator [Cupriavidus sp. AcVe19-6a]|uniref:LysR family transcriptional regulator n=1 Tax=Cupriavidus sp. AcVe19-6a TaxID=2821358 RepID=UPI001AE3A891|nr:LysR family transcriptional regulator [Cupriavidus sp. AcVe19-6a]MBP0637490.1 LysR family transcriptional regulator [Cupriavidus sp. AcVe19-6a]
MEIQHAPSANNDPFLRDLRLFCTVARRASFIAAAQETGISPAHVSKRIAMLEAMLGARLFHRTTRRVSVTAEGESAFAWAQKILEDVDGMLEAVGGAGGEARGQLRIATSLRLGRRHVAPVLSLLRQQHPGLEVWLELLDRRVDLIGEQFDLDIRVGEVHEPHLIASRIATGSRVLCAAPAYLARRGMPEHPSDLPRHDCLLLRERDQAFGVWRLQGEGGNWETTKVTGPMASNVADVTHEWALEGYGIIMASVWDVAAAVRAGDLVRVLPGWHHPSDIWAVTSARASASARMRVCLAFLKAQLTQGPHALATSLEG